MMHEVISRCLACGNPCIFKQAEGFFFRALGQVKSRREGDHASLRKLGPAAVSGDDGDGDVDGDGEGC